MVSTGEYMYLLNHLDLYVDLYIWKNRAFRKVSWQNIAPDMRGYQVIIFLISQWKHMLWILIWGDLGQLLLMSSHNMFLWRNKKKRNTFFFLEKKKKKKNRNTFFLSWKKKKKKVKHLIWSYEEAFGILYHT